jgi:hypothetical protein
MERDDLESRAATQIAREVMARLPFSDNAREALVRSGQALVAKMGWDQVIEDGLLPMLERIRQMQHNETNGNGA